MDTEKLKKCSDCKCNKLLKYFKLRQNTGQLYKTCMQCCEKGKKNRKKCICGKSEPSFGMIDDEKPTCCSNCKLDGMVDIKHKKCICGVRPNFGFINDRTATCCANCKLDGMVDIIHKKCICGVIPCFGFINDRTATCCSNCKLDGMVDLVNKKCICNKSQPIFGMITDKFPTCCLKCKSDDMVDIKHKKCICGVIPVFGMIGDTAPTCCVICKSDDMFDIVNKKCICNKSQPCFGFINDKKPTCCVNCKSDDMVNIVSKRCITPLCDTQIYNPKYKGYCSRCFFFTFPDEPLTRNYKTKENSFIKPLHEKFSQYDHSHDKIIKYGCSKKRPDNITDFGSHVIVVEVDEGGHKNYECEMLRMMLILNDIGGRPIIFIRLNCDSYKINRKRINSPFAVDKETGNLVIKNKKEFNTRLDKLFDTFDYYSEDRGYKTFEMIELFY